MGNDRRNRLTDDITGVPLAEREMKGPGQKASGAPPEERPDRLIDDRPGRGDGLDPVDNDPSPPVGGPAPERDLDVDIIPLERGAELVDRGGIDGDDNTDDDVTTARMSHKPQQRGDNGGTGGGGGGGGGGDGRGGNGESVGWITDIEVTVGQSVPSIAMAERDGSAKWEPSEVDASEAGDDSPGWIDQVTFPETVMGAAPDAPVFHDVTFTLKNDDRTETVDLDESGITGIDDWESPVV